MSENWTIPELVAEWYTERELSRRKLAFLEQNHERTMQEIGLVTSFAVADGLFADELDLEKGSYWVQVQAALLDLLKGPIGGWYRASELDKQLYQYEHIDEYDDIDQFNRRKLITRDDWRGPQFQ